MRHTADRCPITAIVLAMYERSVRELETHGVAVVPEVMRAVEVEELRRVANSLLMADERRRVGVRQAIQRAPEIGEVLERSSFGELLNAACGVGSRVVRAVVFDKTAESNWMVPWHQDATVAVMERREIPGFGPWAVKDGEHHCQPPLHVLKSIVTIRVHLDDCPMEVGPLRVVARSHTRGLLDAREIEECVESGRVIDTPVNAGDVVLTTPLAVHSSRRSTLAGARRRVLHLDCSNITLPGGLQWAEAS